jgi:hypothetical protein
MGWLKNGPGMRALLRIGTAIAPAASQATRRQRGEGSRPSGNSSSPKVKIGVAPVTHTHEETQAAARPPGNAPGLVTRAYCA